MKSEVIVYSYTGSKNLEAMQEAVNYNRYQYNFIHNEIRKINKRTIKILDFGAGIGTYADILQSDNLVIECVEPTPSQAKVLKAKGYKVYADIAEVNSTYDLIYSLNVLEHIEDDSAILSSLKQRLKRDGEIVIYVPAFMVLFTNLDVLVEHFRRYRIRDMRKLAEDNNLELKTVKYCDPVGFFAALAYRVIRGNGELNPRSIKIFDKYLFPVSVISERLFSKVLGKNVLAIFVKP